MKALVATIIAIATSTPAEAAPAIHSYLMGLESLSSANDERGSVFEGSVVKSMSIAGHDGNTQVVEVHVLAKDDAQSQPYAKDVYLLTVGSYAQLKSIQFSERIQLKK